MLVLLGGFPELNSSRIDICIGGEYNTVDMSCPGPFDYAEGTRRWVAVAVFCSTIHSAEQCTNNCRHASTTSGVQLSPEVVFIAWNSARTRSIACLC